MLQDSSHIIFDTFDFGVLIEDNTRSIIYANKKFREIFNVPERIELKGQNCIEIASVSKSFFRLASKFEADIVEIPRNSRTHEEIVETADGRFFKRKFSSICAGESELLIWSYEEVTALVKKERELEEQKTFYNKVLNEIPADIAIFSPEHKYIYLNRTAVKNDEIRSWMIGKDDYEYCAYRNLDKSIADNRRAHFNKVVTEGGADMWVDKRVTPDGQDDYVLRIFYPYINSHSKLEFVIGYGVNITQQKKQELAVEKQRERFRTLINTLNDGVFQLAFGGKVMFYNTAFLKAMGLNEGDIGEEYDNSIMKHVHPDDQDQLYRAFELLKIIKQPQHGIFRIYDSKSGETKYVDYVIWHRGEDQEEDMVIGRLSDVTERVHNEKNMLKLIEKEKELNAQQSNFIHITSHELRTPLSVIMSSAEILEMAEEMNGGEAKHDVQIDRKKFTSGIVKEVVKITDILNELLVVGRIENNKVRFSPALVNATSYINGIVEELYSPYSDGRTLSVNINAAVAEVYIDTTLMRHAIVNIINNAFKYSEGSKAPCLSVFKKDGMVHLEVKDYGIGIPGNEKEKVFKSFYRASNVGNVSGTGIGLMVVDYAVKSHSGLVKLESKKGKGTTFTIMIPDMSK